MGIADIDGGNFDAIVAWFDVLSSPGTRPHDHEGLRALVDAAPVGVASTDSGFLGTAHAGWNDMRNAVFGLVRNGSNVTVSGWTGGDIVIVRIGVYRVEIVFGNLPPVVKVPGVSLSAQLAWLWANAQSGNIYLVEINTLGNPPALPGDSKSLTFQGI